jgi:hypothetical protein
LRRKSGIFPSLIQCKDFGWRRRFSAAFKAFLFGRASALEVKNKTGRRDRKLELHNSSAQARTEYESFKRSAEATAPPKIALLVTGKTRLAALDGTDGASILRDLAGGWVFGVYGDVGGIFQASDFEVTVQFVEDGHGQLSGPFFQMSLVDAAS